MQHFDGWSTLEGRHLVFVYGFVLLAQTSYFAYVLTRWLKIRRASDG